MRSRRLRLRVPLHESACALPHGVRGGIQPARYCRGRWRFPSRSSAPPGSRDSQSRDQQPPATRHGVTRDRRGCSAQQRGSTHHRGVWRVLSLVRTALSRVRSHQQRPRRLRARGAPRPIRTRLRRGGRDRTPLAHSHVGPHAHLGTQQGRRLPERSCAQLRIPVIVGRQGLLEPFLSLSCSTRNPAVVEHHAKIGGKAESFGGVDLKGDSERGPKVVVFKLELPTQSWLSGPPRREGAASSTSAV